MPFWDADGKGGWMEKAESDEEEAFHVGRIQQTLGLVLRFG